MRKSLRVMLLAAVMWSCASVHAQERTWAVAGKAGSLGVGADIHRVIFPDKLNLRIGASFFQRGVNFSNSGIKYVGTLRVGAVPVSLDAYPFKNWFRVQAGLMVNLNRLTGTAQLTNDMITIGNHTYTSNTIGSLQGTVNVDRVAPFFGVGFGNPIKKDKRWGIFLDVGAMYHGDPTLTLQTTEMGSPLLTNDLQLQEQRFGSATHRYIFYPILQIGVTFR